MDTKYYNELRKIIEINSWTENKKGVDTSSKMFANWVEKIGMRLQRYERESIGDHLHFISRKTNGKKLLLLGHTDTVFAPDTFEEYKEDEEWIYGPGVCDMKGGNFVALQALRKIYDKYGEILNIDLLLVSDEETGSDDSRHLTAKLAPEYDYCMVFEAAGQNGEIVTGRKGIGWFTLEIEGIAKHAGNHYWDGADANQEAACKLIDLSRISDKGKQTTVNVGIMEGGIGANTVSPHAKLAFDLRYTEPIEKERALKAIDKIVSKDYIKGTKSTLSGGILRDVMQPNSAQLAWIERINTLCNTSMPTEQRGGVSDANIIASVGVIVTDGWGPFGDGDHTVHERASKKSFDERIALVTEIFEHHTEGKL
ncbi:MAG: M20 family metallopeptidase [Sulfurovum sp.]|nr:M20 family metallopeptidase [Sulfurovum sp.]